MRRVGIRSLFSFVLIGALACIGEAGTGPFESEGQFYEDIVGSYSAPISVTDQGHTLDVVLTLTVTQFGGELGGTYSSTGTLDGAPVTDTGTLTGFLTDVLDPDVDIVFRSGLCATVQTRFVGSMSSSTRVLTLSGDYPIANTDCSPWLTFATVLLFDV